MRPLKHILEDYKDFRKNWKLTAKWEKEHPVPVFFPPNTDWKDQYEEYCFHMEHKPTKLGFIWFKLQGKYYFLTKAEEYVQGMLCVLLGHKIEDQGYANSESGCIELVCTRCGYCEGRHYLY